MKGAVKKKASRNNKLTDCSRYPSIYTYVGAAPEKLWPSGGIFCKMLSNTVYDHSQSQHLDLQRTAMFSYNNCRVTKSPGQGKFPCNDKLKGGCSDVAKGSPNWCLQSF